MKTLFILLLSSLIDVALASGEIQIVRDGAAVQAVPGKAFEAHVVRLLESCEAQPSRCTRPAVGAGDQIHACAMYAPKAWLSVVTDPALNLAGVQPYSNLAVLYRH
ncbi:MAG: hypothetical protein ABI821_01760 [Pseudomonadota bacterium]